MISYYIIPRTVYYVQFLSEIRTWERIDRINPYVPTVAVIEDSIPTGRARFVVIFKGMMQTTGGSGSCYNPAVPTFAHGHNPMDNNVIPPHMMKWKIYNYNVLLDLIIESKYNLLVKMGYNLPAYFYHNLVYYDTNKGLLIGMLDLVGMGKADVSILKHTGVVRKNIKLLTA